MNESEPRVVAVRNSPIALSQFLKFSGLAATGGEAKQLIARGAVEVNGAPESRRARQLVTGDKVKVAEKTIIVGSA